MNAAGPLASTLATIVASSLPRSALRNSRWKPSQVSTVEVRGIPAARAIPAMSEPVDVAVPAFNAIWQRDANSYALRALGHCGTPPRILNITGPETVLVRSAAEFFAARFARPCRLEGTPGPVALLSDSSAARALMGPPGVTTARLMEMVADWVEGGGASLNKPTHFEVADGKF